MYAPLKASAVYVPTMFFLAGIPAHSWNFISDHLFCAPLAAVIISDHRFCTFALGAWACSPSAYQQVNQKEGKGQTDLYVTQEEK